jgi:ubiquitin C
VKTITFKMFTLDVEPNDSIKSIIAKIKDKQGIRLDQQRLIFAGRPLEDDRNMINISIYKDAPFPNFEFRSFKNIAISVEICNVEIATNDLEPTHFIERAKTQDKVDVCSYLKSVIFADNQL